MKKLSLLLLCLSLGAAIARSEVKPAGIFSNNMVIQRGEPVRVWGTADRNERVEVAIAGLKATAKADRNGRWSATLAPMEAGGPYTMVVSGKSSAFTIENVLVGEVWLCSGQSNMEWTVRSVNDSERERANADYPEIRCFTVTKAMSADPLDEFDGSWKVCSPETVADFTAVGYFFARKLWQELGVPVGIVNSSWGGTDIEAWTSTASYEALGGTVASRNYDPRVREMLEQSFSGAGSARRGEYRAALANDPALAARWFDDATDPAEWGKMNQPQEWASTPLGMADGHVWFRREFSVSESDAGKSARLSLGTIDDNEITWINGVEVGRTDGYNIFRRYNIPEGLLRSGKNVITVRVTDNGTDGGFRGNPEDILLTVGENAIPLAGEWLWKSSVINTDYGVVELNPNSYYSTLYNAMINPMTGFRIKGAIWYQGENNAWNAHSYRTLFPNMIRDWRTKWGYEFPFYWVQLANFMAEDAKPVDSDWAELREAQTMTLSVPQTGQAVIIDIGDARDIHPRNKQDVGLRLALCALHNDYGRTGVVYSGPELSSMTIERGRVTIEFEDGGSPPAVRNKYGYIEGFAVAGADRVFHWARASLTPEGKVVVWSPDVREPVAVRYAWGNNPMANLFNAEGLPAGPFRTDDWPGITK